VYLRLQLDLGVIKRVIEIVGAAILLDVGVLATLTILSYAFLSAASFSSTIVIRSAVKLALPKCNVTTFKRAF
jgi:hypothetical protein